MATASKLLQFMLAEPVERAYADCVDRLIENIAKHLGSGNAIRTADWELNKLQEMGKLTEENAKIINATLKSLPNVIKEALSDASKEALADIDKLIEEAITNGAIEQAPETYTKQVLEQLTQQALDDANLTNTTMLESSQAAYLTAINNVVSWAENELTSGQVEEALNIVNDAAMAQAVGSETRQQVMKKAIAHLSEKGIYGFVDRAGRHWTPEAYMGMVVRTTSHNTMIESVQARQKEYKSDIFQVSSHAGARPLCYPYQGKFYTWGNESGTFTDGDGKRHSYKPISSTSYGKPAGLFGINCGHRPLPVIPGVSIPQDKQIQDKETNNKEYAELQKMRSLERDVREAKRKALAYKAAGLDDEFAAQSKKVREAQAAYNQFAKAAGRKKRLDRTQVEGYTNVVRKKNDPKKGLPSTVDTDRLHENLQGYLGTKTKKDTKEKVETIYKKNDIRYLERFIMEVDKGDLSVLTSVDHFINTGHMLEKELVGLKASNGQRVTGVSAHFTARFLGYTADSRSTMRQGVTLEMVKDAIDNGKVKPIKCRKSDGEQSQQLVGKEALVTINPETGILIQTNRKAKGG